MIKIEISNLHDKNISKHEIIQILTQEIYKAQNGLKNDFTSFLRKRTFIGIPGYISIFLKKILFWEKKEKEQIFRQVKTYVDKFVPEKMDMLV
jgi:hypothetical protein